MIRIFDSLLSLFYNIALAIGLVLSIPILLCKSLAVPGYARWIWRRLMPPMPLMPPTPRIHPASPKPKMSLPPSGREGETRAGDGTPFRRSSLGHDRVGSPVIWLHALSVGETMAARPLLAALRRRYPGALLLFSSSTRAGFELARTICANSADRLLVMPSDLPWGAGRLARQLRPDLFILVETDFWPNLLRSLRKQGTALLLVNGRISSASWRHHRRWGFLSRPLIFAPFSHLAMQSAEEADRLRGLGLDPARISVPGNLKYPAAMGLLTPEAGGALSSASATKAVAAVRRELASGPQKIFWLAGSTHPGEEEILIRVFRRLFPQFPQLLLMLAPRRIERAASVLAMARKQGCRAQRLGEGGAPGSNLLVLDSYGSLAALYPLSDLAFIGGSLVPEGGHNPLEAAVWHRPVIFGRHMEDFAGIANDLLAAGAARRVEDEEELLVTVRNWLLAPDERLGTGQRAGDLVATMGKGVITAHMKLVEEMIAARLRKGLS